MNFVFNFENLRKLGYQVDVTPDTAEVRCSSTGQPVLQQSTFRRIYQDLEKTTLTIKQAEQAVETFATTVLNQEIWNIAVKPSVGE